MQLHLHLFSPPHSSDFSSPLLLNLHHPLQLMRHEGTFFALEQHGGLQAVDRVPHILGDVHPETAVLVAEHHALDHGTAVVVGRHRHPSPQHDERLVLRGMVMHRHHRPRLHRIQEPVALLIQALVEIEIHPQPRRGLRLRRELVEKMLVNNHKNRSAIVLKRPAVSPAAWGGKGRQNG